MDKYYAFILEEPVVTMDRGKIFTDVESTTHTLHNAMIMKTLVVLSGAGHKTSFRER